MKTARIIVLGIALSAGGVAAWLASGSNESKPVPEPVAQLPTVDVLVAKADIGLGQSVKPEDMVWQTWPSATASSTMALGEIPAISRITSTPIVPISKLTGWNRAAEIQSSSFEE